METPSRTRTFLDRANVHGQTSAKLFLCPAIRAPKMTPLPGVPRSDVPAAFWTAACAHESSRAGHGAKLLSPKLSRDIIIPRRECIIYSSSVIDVWERSPACPQTRACVAAVAFVLIDLRGENATSLMCWRPYIRVYIFYV